MSDRVAVVTDSTASLPSSVAQARGVRVIPLSVVIGATTYDEGVEGGATSELLAQALREWTPVSTSRPNPDRVLEVFRQAALEGAESIVVVTLSAELSGTHESVQIAARDSPVPVHLVDSRQVGMGTGYAALLARDLLDDGAEVDVAAAAARARAEATSSYFYVDTLEHLRRGGRMGAAAALLGSALAVKPILRVHNGRLEPHERVRTSGKALARMAELAIESAGQRPVDVAVAHLANEERADALVATLTERLGDQLEGRAVLLGEIGAVLGAHVGPGMVGVTVAPRG